VPAFVSLLNLKVQGDLPGSHLSGASSWFLKIGNKMFEN
jgi:hypothetical protein